MRWVQPKLHLMLKVKLRRNQPVPRVHEHAPAMRKGLRYEQTKLPMI